MNPKPSVILFCGRLLPASETFIPLQGEGLQKFTPHYVGTRFVPGVALPPERIQVVNQGGVWGTVAEIVFKILGIAPQMSQHLQTLNPVLVHAHFGVCGALALPLLNAVRVPLIVTFHGLDATMTDDYARRHSISTRVYLHRREALKQKTHLFICVSEFIKAKLLQQGFPGDKLLVHYIGIDTHLFRPDPTITREPVVLFVGRFVEKKGCEYLLQAMVQVSHQQPEASLVVIGDGPLRPDLEALAARTLPRYKFLGMQPAKVVRDWMHRSQVFVVPSVTSTMGDSEGLPMVVLEAQAMGLPVVASRHGGIPEAVIHEETGFLVNEREWQTLARYILVLLQDISVWQRLSVNGRQSVLDNFDVHQQTQILEDIYDGMLENKRLQPQTPVPRIDPLS